MESAVKFAERMAALSPDALKFAKLAINNEQNRPISECLDIETQYCNEEFATPNASGRHYRFPSTSKPYL